MDLLCFECYCGETFAQFDALVRHWHRHLLVRIINARAVSLKKHKQSVVWTRGMPPAARFWSKVNKDGPQWKDPETGEVSHCWVWIGTQAHSSWKYGQFSIGGISQYAHRVSWKFTFGEIPDGMNVRLKCKTPLCVNPNHLILQTPQQQAQDNVLLDRNKNAVEALRNYWRGRDTKAKFLRQRRDERKRQGFHAGSRLTESQVRKIRALHGTGHTLTEIARRFGTDLSNISRIVAGKTWKNMERH